MGKRKVNGVAADLLSDKTIKYAALGVGAIVLLKAFNAVDGILETFGLKDSAESKALDNAATTSSSFWQPNFWRGGGANTLILNSAAANAAAKNIYDAFGAFNDNEEQAIGVFRSMKTQSQVSYLAEVFYNTYKQDLLNFLRGGSWPQDRLSDADVSAIHSYILSLPKYRL